MEERVPLSGGRGRILLVDNYDSYTYNLYQYLAEVCCAAPLVVKNADKRGLDRAFLRQFSGVVISPGPGHPGVSKDIGVSKEACVLCAELGIPVLGVCLGFQAMGLWEGCRVIKAPHVIHGEIADVTHDGEDPLFRRIPRTFKVVRYHSLIIDPATVDAARLQVTAATVEDGDGFRLAERLPWHPEDTSVRRVIPMGLKVVGKKQWGVQFHPESVCTQYGHELVENFVEICGVRDPDWAQHVPRQGLFLRHLPCAEDTARRLHVDSIALAGSSPLAVFEALYKTAKNVVWLDSSTDKRGRYSIMADDCGTGAFRLTYSVDSGRCEVDGPGGASFPADTTDVMGSIEAFLAERRGGFVANTDVQPPLPFQGGFLGYLGYEMRGECLKHAHDVSVKPCAKAADGAGAEYGEDALGAAETSLDMPDTCLLYVEDFVVVDHLEGVAHVCTVSAPGPPNPNRWATGASVAIRGLCPPEAQEAAKEQVEEEEEEKKKKDVNLTFVPSKTKEEYISSIKRCKELILEGETYEVCLTNEFECRLVVEDTLEFYKQLRVINAAPYGGYIRVDGRGDVCSSSPERFLKITSEGVCEAKPIKGTIKRSQDPVEDERLKEELRSSVKDQCENLMIADLLRNDLGMLCEAGSVKVPYLMDIESYKTVHQMVTTVRGVLPHATSHASALNVTFPGGSIVGAPKVRTMSIIQSLEGRRRGIYTGSLGHLSLCGCSDFNIAIRTAVISRNAQGAPVLRIGAGGAITILSDPEGEWDEVWLLLLLLLLFVLLLLSSPRISAISLHMLPPPQIMIKAYPLMRTVSRILTGSEDSYSVAL